MSDWFMEDEPDLTIPEDTIVRAKVDDIQTETIEFTDKKTGEQKELAKTTFWFEVTEQGTYCGRKIKKDLVGRDAKPTNHPENKFRPIVEALLGRDIAVGMQVARDDLMNLPCKLTVVHVKGNKDPNRVFDQVDEVLPAGDFVDTPPF